MEGHLVIRCDNCCGIKMLMQNRKNDLPGHAKPLGRRVIFYSHVGDREGPSPLEPVVYSEQTSIANIVIYRRLLHMECLYSP